MRALRTHCVLLALLLLAIASSPLSAQQSASASPPASSSDSQAVALIQRSIAALSRGGPVSDVTLTGTARRIAGSDDETGTATLTAAPGGYSKLSLNFPSGPRTEIRNPAGTPRSDSLPRGVPVPANLAIQPVGAWSGPDGVLHGVASHNAMTDAAWFFPAFTIASLGSSGPYTVSYVGQETLDGMAVIHLSAVQQVSDSRAEVAALMQHLSQMDVFLAPSTLLPAALSFNTHPDNNAAVDLAVKVLFSDYRSVNGVQVPFHVQKYLNGGLALDIQFSTATLNSGVTSAAFEIQ